MTSSALFWVTVVLPLCLCLRRGIFPSSSSSYCNQRITRLVSRSCLYNSRVMRHVGRAVCLLKVSDNELGLQGEVGFKSL